MAGGAASRRSSHIAACGIGAPSSGVNVADAYLRGDENVRPLDFLCGEDGADVRLVEVIVCSVNAHPAYPDARARHFGAERPLAQSPQPGRLSSCLRRATSSAPPWAKIRSTCLSECGYTSCATPRPRSRSFAPRFSVGMTTPGAISTVGPSGGVAIVARVWSGTLAARPAWSRAKKKQYIIDIESAEAGPPGTQCRDPQFSFRLFLVCLFFFNF